MSIKKFILFVLLAIIGFGFYLYYRLGAHREVQVELAQTSEFHMIYKQHVGPYHKVNSVLEEVETWAEKNDIVCSTTVGEYLDDPKTVEEDRLRANVGCLLQTKNNFNWSSLEEHSYKTVPAQKMVRVNFKGSPAIGPFTVYPEVESFAKDRGLDLQERNFEIYKLEDQSLTTIYLFPLEKDTAHPNSSK